MRRARVRVTPGWLWPMASAIWPTVSGSARSRAARIGLLGGLDVQALGGDEAGDVRLHAFAEAFEAAAEEEGTAGAEGVVR